MVLKVPDGSGDADEKIVEKRVRNIFLQPKLTVSSDGAGIASVLNTSLSSQKLFDPLSDATRNESRSPFCWHCTGDDPIGWRELADAAGMLVADLVFINSGAADFQKKFNAMAIPPEEDDADLPASFTSAVALSHVRELDRDQPIPPNSIVLIIPRFESKRKADQMQALSRELHL